MAQMSDDERCDGMAQTGIVLISNGKDRCRGAKKGHGTELRIDAVAMSCTAGRRQGDGWNCGGDATN